MNKYLFASVIIGVSLTISGCSNNYSVEENPEVTAIEFASELTIEPTKEAEISPSSTPTLAPTQEPTQEPTIEPTQEPTIEPTQEPTIEPTQEPTIEPTQEPTIEPTQQPTQEPTQEPTQQPTKKIEPHGFLTSIKNINNKNDILGAEKSDYDGEWIYYVNEMDNNKLYKMKHDGTNRTKIFDQPISSLQVKDDWIYYLAVNTEVEKLRDYDVGSIYRIDKNGNNNTKLLSEKNELRSEYLSVEESIGSFTIIDNEIIFICVYHFAIGGGDSSCKVMKANIDGSEKTVLGIARTKTKSPGYFGIRFSKINDNKLYFSDLGGHFNPEHHMQFYDIDSFESSTVFDCMDYAILDEWIAYYSHELIYGPIPETGDLIIRNKETNESITLLEDVSINNMKSLNNTIYYSNSDGIFSININEKETKKIIDEYVDDFCVICDEDSNTWVYYSSNWNISRVKEDGTSKSLVVKGHDLMVFNGKLYYVNNHGNEYRRYIVLRNYSYH